MKPMSDDILDRIDKIDLFADPPQKVGDLLDDAGAEIRRLRELVHYWVSGAQHHAARAAENGDRLE
jgi:hypothetical protein